MRELVERGENDMEKFFGCIRAWIAHGHITDER